MEYDRMKEVKEFDDSKIGVKGLIDSGITTIPRFFVHPPENLPDPNKPSLSSIGIPIIDLSNTQRSQIVDQVSEAVRSWGFFQVINHSIPFSVLETTINAIKSFHEQPPEVKGLHYGRDPSVSYATNIDLFQTKAASWRDTLMVSFDPEKLDIDRIPEICRDELIAWDDHIKNLGEILMEILGEGLGLESGKLKKLGCLNGRVVLGHYYPYCPQPELTIGIHSHTDSGILTVVLQDQIGGLQVKHGGDWFDIKPQPGALVINIGDFLKILSNNEYTSGEHRVLANASQEARVSIATFFNFSIKKDDSNYYGPFDELVTPEKPALYPNFTMSEYYLKRFGEIN